MQTVRNRILLVFVLMMLCCLNSEAAELASAAGAASQEKSLEAFLGAWAFELPDGNPAWLKFRREDQKLQGDLLWSVGSAKPVQQIAFHDGELSFERRIRWRPFGDSVTMQVAGPLTARIAEGQLLLSFRQHVVGQTSSELESVTLRGTRISPPPKAPDMSTVRFGAPVRLFNGENLDGWKLSNPRKKNGWQVVNGVLTNSTPKTDFAAYGDYGNLMTERRFSDFRLDVEYNVSAGGNSGIYLRGMYEAQVVDRDSRMQGIQGPGAIFGRIAPTHNAAKAGGQWNRYVLTLVDRHITVELNGETVISQQLLEGCTGGGILANDDLAGPILLQGDHTSVQYRNIVLTPVVN